MRRVKYTIRNSSALMQHPGGMGSVYVTVPGPGLEIRYRTGPQMVGAAYGLGQEAVPWGTPIAIVTDSLPAANH